jgi:hypothetical protein
VVHVPRAGCIELLRRLRPYPSGPGPDVDDGEAVGRWFLDVIPIWLTQTVVDTLFRDLTVAVVIFAVYARLRGRSARFGACVRGGALRVLPLVRVSLCLLLATIALTWGEALLLFQFVVRTETSATWLLAWTGLWIPVTVALLLSPFWVAVPAAIVEGPGPLLRRSWKLVHGHALAVCAILVLVRAIDWGSLQLLGLVATELPWPLTVAIEWGEELLIVSLSAVFAAVGYHALRLEKEGVDVSKLEEIFA